MYDASGPHKKMISAPPMLVEMRENGMSRIRLDADNTATSPVPPILVMHNPAVIADSMKSNPTRRPTSPIQEKPILPALTESTEAVREIDDTAPQHRFLINF